jgi:hypothetical protein
MRISIAKGVTSDRVTIPKVLVTSVTQFGGVTRHLVTVTRHFGHS